MNHTKGPWVLGSPWNAVLAGPGTFRSIATVNTCDDSWGMKPISREEAESNARLIAAAPEMLEALTQLITWYDNYRPKVSVRNGQDPSGFIENFDFMVGRYREIIAKTKEDV